MRAPKPIEVAALALAGLGWVAGSIHADPPLIEHHPLSCSLADQHPRICATIADDGTVKRAKVYFRATGESAFYWSEMTLDFRAFCATLPIPSSSTLSVDYHLWAIDDELSTNRTKDFRITIDPRLTCDNPVIDEDPVRISNLVVWGTTKKQKKLKGFELSGVDFHRFSKR